MDIDVYEIEKDFSYFRDTYVFHNFYYDFNGKDYRFYIKYDDNLYKRYTSFVCRYRPEINEIFEYHNFKIISDIEKQKRSFIIELLDNNIIEYIKYEE